MLRCWWLANRPMPETLREDINSMQSGHSPHEKILQEALRAELRLVNTGLPKSRRRLSNLLKERHPQVSCNDGSSHSFKRSELDYLASITDDAEHEALLLPILIEVETGESTTSVLCEGAVEEKVVSRVLGMPLTCEHGRIRVYKPQLGVLRGKLKTTTAYVFSAQTTA